MTIRSLLNRTAAPLVSMVAAAFLMAAATPSPTPAGAANRPKVGTHGPITIEPPDGAWNSNLDAGIAANLKPNTPTIMMFSASWCPDCKRMKKTVLNTPQVQQNLKKWELIYVDNDTFPSISIAYQARFLPTVAFIGSDGLEMTRTFDDVTPEQFIAWSDDMLARSAKLAKLNQGLKTNPEDAALLHEKADMEADLGLTMIKADPRMLVPAPARLAIAADCFKKLEAAGKPAPKDQVEFVDAVLEGFRDIDAGSAKLSKFQANHPKSSHAADAIFWQAAFARSREMALVRKARMEKKPAPDVDFKALAGKFQQYLDRYPQGRYADAAKRVIEEIKKEEARDQARKSRNNAQTAPAKKS